MAVQAKNEQVREEGLEDSRGDSTLLQDSSLNPRSSWQSLDLICRITQTSLSVILWKPCGMPHRQGIGGPKGDDHLTGISAAWEKLDLRRNEFVTKPVFSQQEK